MSITLKKTAAGSTAAAATKKPTPKAAKKRSNDKLRRAAIGTAKALWRTVIVLAPFFVPLLLLAVLADEGAAADYFLAHLALALVPLVPLAYGVTHIVRNHQRTHPPRNKNGRPIRPAQPALPSLHQRTKDSADIIGNLDTIPWRVAMIGAFLAATIAVGRFLPLSVEDLAAVPDTIRADPQATLITVLVPVAVVGGAYALIYARVASIIRNRADQVGQIYAVARDELGYPKRKPASPTKRQAALLVPHQAIDVKKWRSLEDVDEFFVLAPEELSVEDIDKWDSFDVNLNAKVPRPEEWRVHRDPRGRGATVGAANYPTSILWDGEHDPDPLTFIVGDNLETSKRHTITFNDTSPHSAVSGGTSSGKTSYAEIIAAQVLIKPMPWDPNLYGRVVIIDPKGPFARRWAGRPGVVVANGQEDAAELDDDGNAITGPMVMAAAMEWVEEEHARRAEVLSRHPDVATWVHLPDEVKKAERFAPITVILDEYIDHTDDEPAMGDERIEKENNARHITTRMANWHARKYRNVGMHTILIAQEVKMTLIGSVLMRNLPVRVVTGQMDRHQMQTMFAVDDPSSIPSLPSTRIVYKNGERTVKTIPGRARIMNALGQTINKVQVMYFGGPQNNDTLDKWLPRGEAPPNGDFSFPAGKPRRAEDFDENGEYIGDPTEATYEQGKDQPMDGIEPSAADIVAAEDFGQNPDTSPGPTAVAEESFIDDPADGPPAPKVHLDKDAVFPAAQAQEPRCEHPGCVNDGERQCPKCRGVRCEHHLSGSPNPAENSLMCSTCRQGHPLTSQDAEATYRQIYSLSRGGGLMPQFSVSEDDGAVVMTSWTAKKQKVIEVVAYNGELTARSHAGTVTGAEEVHDRVEETLTAYIRLREQQHSTAGGESQ